MDIQFECSQEDLLGAHLAGLAEPLSVKIHRVAFILTPIVVMVLLALMFQPLFQVYAPNTTLLPIVLFGFAPIYLWAVRANRRHRARMAIAEQLKKKGDGVFGAYQLRIKDEGLEVIREKTRFWTWPQIHCIVANSRYCRIEIPGQDDIIISAYKVGSQSYFELFVRICNTVHFYGQRGITKQPLKKVIMDGDVWDAAYSKPLQADQKLKMAESPKPLKRPKPWRI